MRRDRSTFATAPRSGPPHPILAAALATLLGTALASGASAGGAAAVAELRPLDGVNATGTIRFEPMGDAVRISGEIRGLDRGGKHGFHIHEGTSCEEPGDHFAPEPAAHGSPDQPQRHVGDLGNLVADENGTAEYLRVDPVLSLSGSHRIIGHALVVHRAEDDYVSQPSGDSGAKIACGVIEESEAPSGGS